MTNKDVLKCACGILLTKDYGDFNVDDGTEDDLWISGVPMYSCHDCGHTYVSDSVRERCRVISLLPRVYSGDSNE